MVHPCCGFPLRNGAIILAIIDIIGSIFGTISSVITLVCVTMQKAGDSPFAEDGSVGIFAVAHKSQGITRLLDESSSAVYSVLGFVTLTCVVEMVLSLILLNGAKKSDAAYCKVWWRTKLAIFLASTAVITFAFVVSEDRLDFAVGGIFGIMYQVYGLWVVKAFINELEFSTDCEQKEELPISTGNYKYGDIYNKEVEYVRLSPTIATPDLVTEEEKKSRHGSIIGKTFKLKRPSTRASEKAGPSHGVTTVQKETK